MEQPETPQEPPGTPDPQPPPADKSALPEPEGVLAIPNQIRLPFQGKMATPTAVPSAAERQRQLALQQKRRRRRGFLVGLLVGQFLIIALDLGGQFILDHAKQLKLQAPIKVASIVFLGMAAGAALMLLFVGLVFLVQGIRGLFGSRSPGLFVAIGRGIKRLVLTSMALGVSMGVIVGTAWFMIPRPQWKPTINYAREQGEKGVEASKEKLKSMFKPAPKAR